MMDLTMRLRPIDSLHNLRSLQDRFLDDIISDYRLKLLEPPVREPRQSLVDIRHFRDPSFSSIDTSPS